MATNKLRKADKLFFEKLGKRITKIILEDQKYKSFDAFALAHHDKIAKPTIYQLAEGKRDPKVTTLRRLAEALGISLEDLIAGL